MANTPINLTEIVTAITNLARRLRKLENMPRAGPGSANHAIHDNVPNEIALIPEQLVPVLEDMIVIEAFDEGNAKKMVRIGNLPLSEGIAIPVHDHSGDAGDGGRFEAVNLKSTGEATGQVLGADGLGGTVWRSDALVAHQHTGIGDGGVISHLNLSDIGNNPHIEVDILMDTGWTKADDPWTYEAC